MPRYVDTDVEDCKLCLDPDKYNATAAPTVWPDLSGGGWNYTIDPLAVKSDPDTNTKYMDFAKGSCAKRVNSAGTALGDGPGDRYRFQTVVAFTRMRDDTLRKVLFSKIPTAAVPFDYKIAVSDPARTGTEELFSYECNFWGCSSNPATFPSSGYLTPAAAKAGWVMMAWRLLWEADGNLWEISLNDQPSVAWKHVNYVDDLNPAGFNVIGCDTGSGTDAQKASPTFGIHHWGHVGLVRMYDYHLSDQALAMLYNRCGVV